MRDIGEGIKEFFCRDWTISEKILVIVCCILLGMLKGFFWAPVKKGISIGNNNANTHNHYDEEYWLDDEE